MKEIGVSIHHIKPDKRFAPLEILRTTLYSNNIICEYGKNTSGSFSPTLFIRTSYGLIEIKYILSTYKNFRFWILFRDNDKSIFNLPRTNNLILVHQIIAFITNGRMPNIGANQRMNMVDFNLYSDEMNDLLIKEAEMEEKKIRIREMNTNASIL